MTNTVNFCKSSNVHVNVTAYLVFLADVHEWGMFCLITVCGYTFKCKKCNSASRVIIQSWILLLSASGATKARQPNSWPFICLPCTKHVEWFKPLPVGSARHEKYMTIVQKNQPFKLYSLFLFSFCFGCFSILCLLFVQACFSSIQTGCAIGSESKDALKGGGRRRVGFSVDGIPDGKSFSFSFYLEIIELDCDWLEEVVAALSWEKPLWLDSRLVIEPLWKETRTWIMWK